MITALFPSSGGGLWIGTEGEGLLRYDPESSSTNTYLPWSTVTALQPTANEELWVGTDDSDITIFAISPDEDLTETSSIERALPTGITVSALLEDSAGRIWIGTRLSGIYCYHPDTRELLHSAHDPRDVHSIPYSFISDIFQDAGGVIWVGTVLGVATTNPWSMQFEQYQTLGDAGSHLIDSEGTLWSAANRGLARIDRNTNTATLYEYPRGGEAPDGDIAPADDASADDAEWNDELWIRDMRMDARKRLWMSSSGRGIFRFDPHTERFTQYTSDDFLDRTSIGLESDEIYALAIDARDVVWAGNLGSGDRSLQRRGRPIRSRSLPRTLGQSRLPSSP